MRGNPVDPAFKCPSNIVWLVGGSGKLGLTIAEILQPSYNVLNLSRGKGKEDAENYRNYSIDLSDSGSLAQHLDQLKKIYLPRAIVFCQRYRPAEQESGFDAVAAMNTEILSSQRIIETISAVPGRGPLSIVILSSVNGFLIDHAMPFWYHWVKASQIQLVKYYSVYPHNFPFNINCIAPGTFLKDSIENYPEKYRAFFKVLREKNSHAPVCTKQDIAHIVQYLISDRAACLNGQIITPDGGFTNKLQEAMVKTL